MNRVAFITPYLPWPPDTGGKLRSYYLLQGLAARAEVDLFTVYDQEPSEPDALAGMVRKIEQMRLERPSGRNERLAALLARTPRSVRFFQTPQSLADVRAQIASGYDLHVCDEIVMAPYCLPPAVGDTTPRLIMRQKVDHAHYFEMAAARPWGRDKMLDWLEGRRLRTFELEHMPRFQAGVVCSEADRQVIQQQMTTGAPVEVLVNGADTVYFTPQRAPDPRPTVLLMGTMHYYPNIDAALYFFREVYPALREAVPEVQVLIVGHQPPPEITALAHHPGVTITGSVQDVRPFLARSWVMAVPLRLGGGTRLKIMEALASALPVVSTTVGAEGTGISNGEQLLLADTPQAFVAQTVRLLQDAGLRDALAARGLAYVRAHFSWQALGARFAQFCIESAAGAAHHPAVGQRASRPSL